LPTEEASNVLAAWAAFLGAASDAGGAVGVAVVE
jgi:TRAP-type C4-dicarboxylate transport system permease small subunit